MLVFNSDDLAPGKRMGAWQEFAARNAAAIRSEPAGEHPFRVHAEGKMVGEFVMGRLIGSGHVSKRTSLEIAEQRQHYYGAVIHLAGQPLIRSRGLLTRVQACDISILSTMDDFWFGGEMPFEYMLVRLPQELMEAHVFRPDRLCGSVISHANPLRAILADYVASVFNRFDGLSPSAAATVNQHFVELLSAAVAEEPLQLAGSASLRAALFDRACRLIVHCATDPDLRAEQIARHLGTSVRGLQRIFKENGETVTRRIAKTRIERSMALLESDRAHRVTITQLAFACGFRDLTTFERTFHTFNGMTPSAWRRGLQA